jgi:hypothetical protein
MRITYKLVLGTNKLVNCVSDDNNNKLMQGP